MKRLQQFRSVFGVLSVVVLLSMLSVAPVSAQDGTQPGTIENTWERDAYVTAQMDAAPSYPKSRVIVVAQQRFEQINNRAELAEYLATAPHALPSPQPARVRVAILGADAFEQVADRQEVARYQAALYDAPLPAGSPEICLAVTGHQMPEQIENRMQLAEYQAHMNDSWLPERRESLRIVVLPHRSFEQVVRQQEVTVHEAEIMAGPLVPGRRIAVIAPGILY